MNVQRGCTIANISALTLTVLSNVSATWATSLLLMILVDVKKLGASLSVSQAKVCAKMASVNVGRVIKANFVNKMWMNALRGYITVNRSA